MLVGIDVGVAGVRNHEVQAIGRERAVDQMVRRARVLRARLGVWVAERADNIFFESGPRAVIGDSNAWHEAPWIVSELLGRRGLYQCLTRHRCRQCGTTAQKTP